MPGSLTSADAPGPACGRRQALLFTLLATALLAVVVARHGPRLYDDAFITLRYARNVVDGHGLVYNPGERVLGTSAPLFALLLALPGLLLGPDALPAIATALGVAAFAATAFVSFRLLSRYAGPGIAALGVAAALSTIDALQVFVSGMETPLYLLGIALAVERLAAGRPRAAFWSVAVLPFLHPDAALLLPALLLAVRSSEGRWPWREAFAPIATVVAGGALLLLAYGSPLPHSITAKRLSYARAPLSALADIGATVFEPFLPPPVPPAVAGSFDVAVAAAEVLFLLAAFGALGAVAYRQRAEIRSAPLLALTLFGAFYVAFFAVGNPLVFPWYRPPLEIASGLVAAALAGRLLRAGRSRAAARAFAALLAVSVAARLAVYRPFDTTRREDAYLEAAFLLSPPPGSVLAAPEIGVLGFYTDARILDTVGLVSPRALAFASTPRSIELRRDARNWLGGTIPPGLVAALAPDYVVALSRFLDPLLKADPTALAGYAPVDLGRRVRSADLLVFRRLSASPAALPATR